MERKILTYGSFLFVVILLLNCTGRETEGDAAVMARVGEEQLTVEDARQQIPEFIYREDTVSALSRYRDEWIRRKVLLHEAERLNLAREEGIRKKLQQAREEVLIEGLKDYVIRDFEDDMEVSDEEARSFYQANKNQFILNEEFVRFRHIEAENLESARAARRELMQGIEWPEVARKYDVDPENKIRTSEQYWPISMALGDLDQLNGYLRRIGNTEISNIERINGNYHFVQQVDTRAEGEQPDLEWLIEQIKDWLELRKKNRHFSSFVQNLYLKAESNNEVEVFNVLSTNNKPNIIPDTLETNSTNE